MRAADVVAKLGGESSWDSVSATVNGVPSNGWYGNQIDVSIGQGSSSVWSLFRSKEATEAANPGKMADEAMAKGSKMKVRVTEFEIGDVDMKVMTAMHEASKVWSNPAAVRAIFLDFYSKKVEIIKDAYAPVWEISDPYKYSKDVQEMLTAYLMARFGEALSNGSFVLTGQDSRNKSYLFDKNGRYGEFEGTINSLKVIKRTPKMVDLDYTYTSRYNGPNGEAPTEKKGQEAKRVSTEELFRTWLQWTEDGRKVMADPVVVAALK